jgi:hypothetical protein
MAAARSKTTAMTPQAITSKRLFSIIYPPSSYDLRRRMSIAPLALKYKPANLLYSAAEANNLREL